MIPAKGSPAKNSSERGSAILYIFIAVAALGALIYAASQDSRQSVSNVNNEQSLLQATQLLDYADMLRRAVQAMKVDGIQDAQICFDSPQWSDTRYNQASCSTAKDVIFGPNGGGATFQKPDTALMDPGFKSSTHYQEWVITGANSIAGVGTDCSPTGPCNELVAALPYITQNVCIAINKKMGVTNPTIIPVNADFDVTQPFTGSYPDGQAVSAATLNGKRSGCFKATSTPATNAYVFYSVLISR